MFLAIDDDGRRVAPYPRGVGVCSGCRKRVHAKCGNVNVWHWSHYQDESCDSFHEPETLWHRKWKELFGEECSEIVVRKNDQWHFADIRTSGVIIELQNSPLRQEEIAEREEFYGERMIWVLNSSRFGRDLAMDDLSFKRPTYRMLSSLFYEPELQITRNDDNSVRSITVDFKGEQVTRQVANVLRTLGITYWQAREVFFRKGPTSESKIEVLEWELREAAKSTNYKLDIFGVEYDFSKKWPARSWMAAQRPIFIDYRSGVLFRIKRGMGERSGIGQFHRRDDFVKKYKS